LVSQRETGIALSPLPFGIHDFEKMVGKWVKEIDTIPKHGQDASDTLKREKGDKHGNCFEYPSR